MGITYIEGTVTGPGGSRTLDFLVDSGATYSLLPYEVWTAVGLTAKRTVSFALGDGSRIQRNVSECHIAFSMGDGHSPVIGKSGSGFQSVHPNVASDETVACLTLVQLNRIAFYHLGPQYCRYRRPSAQRHLFGRVPLS